MAVTAAAVCAAVGTGLVSAAGLVLTAALVSLYAVLVGAKPLRLGRLGPPPGWLS